MNRKANPAKTKKSRERRMEPPVDSTGSTSRPAGFGRMNSGCSPTAPFAEKMAPDSRYAEGKLRYNAKGEDTLDYSLWGPWDFTTEGETIEIWLCKAPGFPEVIKVADLNMFFKEAAKTLKSFTVVRVRMPTAVPDGVRESGWNDTVLRKVDGSRVSTGDHIPSRYIRNRDGRCDRCDGTE